MSKKSKSKSISRRKFIQGVGTGVIGSTVAINTLHAKTKGEDQALPQAHKGSELLQFKVNGKDVAVMVEPRTTLIEVLRDQLQLTGTKVFCNQGECGSCTVLLNGKAVYSCHMLALDANGKEVTTIEGLLRGEKLHSIQEAFIEHDGMQCGFCTPGQIMSAQALLLNNPNPTKEQILEGLSGNLCRCSAYPKIVESVQDAAKKK